MKKFFSNPVTIIGVFLILALVAGALVAARFFNGNRSGTFDGARAMQDVEYQVALGDRIPGSPSHAKVVDWIMAGLSGAGWKAEVQQTTMMGHPVVNIIGKQDGASQAGRPWIILGVHYDTRIYADHDPDPQKRKQYVPGADDGASGVAVLLGLARSLPKDLPLRVWLVFFDAEDNGEIPGWDWLLGSQAFVASLNAKPDAAIVVDMIGDKDLNIYLEKTSNQVISAEIWAQAARLGYKQFIPLPKYAMIDDQTPFLQAGIPAVDIIDFDYPYWHTTADTPDKVSAASMQAVGDTLVAWLKAYR